ncbi:MAG: glycosyltransferase family 4 protein [Candidatus Woesearchaeota archaeon]
MKLVYVLPKYDETAGEHFVHIYKLLGELGKRTKLAVVIEKARGIPRLSNVQHIDVISAKLFVPRFFETLTRLAALRLQGYDTFYVHYSFFGAIAASLIGRFSNGKVFYWNCGLPHLFFKSIFEKGWLQSKINDDWPLRLSLKMVDFLVTGTPRMKKYYHHQFGVPLRKILVVPNEIDLSRFKVAKKSNKIPQILFVHRISERKGAHYIVPIAERVLKKAKANFIIAGDGPYLSTLQTQIKKKKLGRYIKTLGSVPNKEIMKLYSQSDVFLMPSDEEGFPRVLLEAMATGTSFVASDVGGVRDIVAKSAQEFVVDRGDVDAFANKLIQLLSDDKLRDKLSKDGLRHVKQYDLKKVVPLLVRTLRNA